SPPQHAYALLDSSDVPSMTADEALVHLDSKAAARRYLDPAIAESPTAREHVGPPRVLARPDLEEGLLRRRRAGGIGQQRDQLERGRDSHCTAIRVGNRRYGMEP